MTAIQKKLKFYEQISDLLGKPVTADSLIRELKLDSMSRSEIVFVIEDIFNVDCWGKHLQGFITLGDFLDDSVNP